MSKDKAPTNMAVEWEDGYNQDVERFREEEYPMLKGWSGLLLGIMVANETQMLSTSTMPAQLSTLNP